jgi:predicted acylesterase/phospholipase RssA
MEKSEDSPDRNKLPAFASVAPSRRESLDSPSRKSASDERTGINTHFFLKWPAYLFIAASTFLLLVGYFAIRGCIGLFERFMEGKNVRQLRRKMIQARHYRDWQAQARKLDSQSGLDAWKQTRRSRYYNSDSIEKYTRELQAARSSNQPNRMLTCLQSCINDPLTSGVLREELYSQCWDGTKTVVEEYVQSVVMGICYLRNIINSPPPDMSADSAHALGREIRCFLDKSSSYGRSGLCLSGGAALGQQHLGVIKALREEGILPEIISGTSAGAVIGAFVCTRTDEELDRDFNPQYLQSISTALNDSWPTRLGRFLRIGQMFDFNDWLKKIPPWTCNDLTFLEAYKKTGRILNISTTANNGSVNLNYITSPNVLIRSAVLCSSAMPFFVKPPKLMEKDSQTDEIHFREAQSFSDGSLAGDVPRGELGSLFGVRFVLTSQVNPHISPFFFNRKGEAGNPLLWRWGRAGSFRGGFILSALESFFKEQMKTLLKVMHDLEIDPAFRGMALPQAFLQNFEGDITVTSNRHFLWKCMHCLESPRDPAEMEWWIKEGELMMWPKMSVMISRMRIERALSELSHASEIHSSKPMSF